MYKRAISILLCLTLLISILPMDAFANDSQVIAKYASGNSPPSSEVKKAIPADLVETPDRPDVNSSAYSETDATNKGRGWLDISWDAVPNATGYKVLIYNGKKSAEYSVGNVTKWSTKGQNIWPTDSEIAAGKYALHSDRNGAELPIDPNPVYKNSAADGGDYASFHRYSIRVKAVSELGTTSSSDSQYGYIPLETPKNVTGSGELVDPVTNKGALTIKWDAVSGAGGYKVELFDGKAYKSFDVGKVTSWNTSGQTLFNDVKDLPADPTQAYQENGAAQSFIDKKAYQFRVKAYRYNDETAPSSEQDKMSGERGLSGPSATAYRSIPMREDLLGLEDSFTYGTHEMGNADVSVNVTAGNMVMTFTDQSLFTRGPLDFDLTRTYNSRSNRPSAFGNGWTFAGNESLTKKDTSDNATLYYEDEDGTRHEFDYDTSKNAYVSPKGKYLTLTKETVNGAAGYRLKDTDGFSKLFEQDLSDAAKYRLSAYQDANKNRILFKHTGDQLTEIAEVDDSGNTVRNSIKLSYTDGLITAVTFKDRSINYQYDNHQLVKTTIKASGTSKTLTNSFDYDEDGQMSEYTDSKGNADTISYDGHQLTLLEPQKSGAESVSTMYRYDDKNNTFEASDTSGRTTTYKRDKDHNTYAVIETENADGTTSKVTEDANYNVLSETDENGKTATHTYDGRGNVLSDTDKEGKTTTYRYDDQNHVIEKVDPDGTKTTNQYSGDNLTRSQIGEEVTQYEYDAYGRQTKVIYPNGTYSTTAYQDSDLKEVEKDAKGNTTSTTYNDYGQTISETDADGRTTSETYDPLNPEIKTSVTDGNGHKTSYAYDDNGNMTSLTNASGKTKTFTYNGNDQLLTTEFPVSGQTTMKTTNTYDDNGNLSKVIENSGIVEQYSYDDVDQLTKAVIQKNGQNVLGWTNTYDDAGQVIGRTLTDLTTNTPLVQKKWTYTADNQLATFTQGVFFN